MDSLFFLLFLVSFGCLVLGLIRPTIFKSLLKEKTSRKRVAWIFGGAMVGSFILFASVLPPPEKRPMDTVSSVSSTSTQQAVAEPAPPVTPPVVSEPTPTEPAVTEPTPEPVQAVVQEPSEDELLRALVQDTFKGTNNMKKERLRKVDIVKQVEDGWGVFIEYNASENITTNLTKKGIETDMSKAYIALYTANLNVKQATVAAYFPLEDQYGNNEDGVVYKTALTNEVADKINWQTPQVTLQARIIPGLWKTTLLNVSFR